MTSRIPNPKPLQKPAQRPPHRYSQEESVLDGISRFVLRIVLHMRAPLSQFIVRLRVKQPRVDDARLVLNQWWAKATRLGLGKRFERRCARRWGPIHRSLRRDLALVCMGCLSMTATLGRAAEPSFTDPVALIDYLEQLYQGVSSEAKMVMEIRTPDYSRQLVLHGMTKGDDYAYFQILEPKKDRGIASLMRDEEMWNFLPKINRVVKVPPSMMMNSWMGSDFSNDDLVKQSSLTEQYDLTLAESETEYFVSLAPKEDTVTVWGRIDYVIEKSPLIPRTQTYFDERGEAVRMLEFSEVQQFGSRLLPSRMTMTPLRKEGHQTVITYDSLALDVEVPDEVFTLQYLKRRR